MTTLVKSATAPALPIVVAEWPRSDRERVRIILAEDVVDARCFIVGDDHEPLRPGRAAITLPLADLPEFVDGIVKTHREAMARGLIDSNRR